MQISLQHIDNIQSIHLFIIVNRYRTWKKKKNISDDSLRKAAAVLYVVSIVLCPACNIRSIIY